MVAKLSFMNFDWPSFLIFFFIFDWFKFLFFLFFSLVKKCYLFFFFCYEDVVQACKMLHGHFNGEKQLKQNQMVCIYPISLSGWWVRSIVILNVECEFLGRSANSQRVPWPQANSLSRTRRKIIGRKTIVNSTLQFYSPIAGSTPGKAYCADRFLPYNLQRFNVSQTLTVVAVSGFATSFPSASTPGHEWLVPRMGIYSFLS